MTRLLPRLFRRPTGVLLLFVVSGSLSCDPAAPQVGTAITRPAEPLPAETLPAPGDPSADKLSSPTMGAQQEHQDLLKLSRENRTLKPQALPNGIVKIDLQGRYRHGKLAKLRSDGQLEHSCVDTPAAASAWLAAEPKVGTREDGARK